MKNHSNYYSANQKYTDFLETQTSADFEKYIAVIKTLIKKNEKMLDVGCGTGIVVQQLLKSEIAAYGVEISKTSIKVCEHKKLKCVLYDGKSIPFNNGYFDCVGSFNVLEHTDSPLLFLKENIRVLKKGGYMIIVCPNFLSITNNYHNHTRGVLQKIKNLYGICIRILSSDGKFVKMKTIQRVEFQPDDDACNVTNPIDIISWSKKNNLELDYWSSQQQEAGGLKRLLDKGPLKYIFGSCFFVFRKL